MASEKRSPTFFIPSSILRSERSTVVLVHTSVHTHGTRLIAGRVVVHKLCTSTYETQPSTRFVLAASYRFILGYDTVNLLTANTTFTNLRGRITDWIVYKE